jgi:hypothetical protein
MSAEITKYPTAAVASVLDSLHLAASKADSRGYFSLFAPDGVFIGTDAKERWTVEDFKKYAQARFEKGQGWTYLAKSRHIAFSPSGEVAWFDEILESKAYGVSRGTGVLCKIDQAWKITQYHLTFPIPNALAAKFTNEIKNLTPH